MSPAGFCSSRESLVPAGAILRVDPAAASHQNVREDVSELAAPVFHGLVEEFVGAQANRLHYVVGRRGVRAADHDGSEVAVFPDVFRVKDFSKAREQIEAGCGVGNGAFARRCRARGDLQVEHDAAELRSAKLAQGVVAVRDDQASMTVRFDLALEGPRNVFLVFDEEDRMPMAFRWTRYLGALCV